MTTTKMFTYDFQQRSHSLLNHAHHHSSLTSENSSVSQSDNLFGIVMYVAATSSVAILTYLDNKRTTEIF